LLCPFPILATAPFQYYLVYPPERRPEPGIRAVREWLLGAARSAVADLPELVGA
jgi:DNA-binding transcriptional LysR family regulator